MPRESTSSRRFPGISILGDLQSEYDANQQEGYRAQSLALREQTIEMREDQQQHVEDLAAKAAAVHNEYISSKLAEQNATLEHSKARHEDATAAWNAIAALDPQSEDYRVKSAKIGADYTAAFEADPQGNESPLAAKMHELDTQHASWQNFNQKAADEQQKLDTAEIQRITTRTAARKPYIDAQNAFIAAGKTGAGGADNLTPAERLTSLQTDQAADDARMSTLKPAAVPQNTPPAAPETRPPLSQFFPPASSPAE